MSTRQVKTSYNGEKLKRIVIGCLALLIAILFIAYLCISQFYKQHFFARTYINGMDCSNLTAEEAKQAIMTGVNEYVLGITSRDGNEQKIIGKDIELTCSFDKEISDVLAGQSAYTWLGNALKDNKLENPYKLSFDQNKLDKAVKNLDCMDKSKQVSPQNAKISKYDEQSGFTVIKEEQGNKLDTKKAQQSILDAIERLNSKLSLEEAECYKKPTVTSEDARITSAMDTINKYMQTKLTYKLGEKTEVFDGTKIGPAIMVDNQYKVSINKEKIQEYVNYLDKTYSTHGGPWTFTDGYGQKKTVKGGSFGWAFAKKTELKEIIATIEEGVQKEKVPQNAAGKDYGEEEIGNTYVEVNLATQHMFLTKNGKKVLDAPVITGNPNQGHATPAGVYRVNTKIRKKTLRGKRNDGTWYNSPVDYWMPFNQGIGLHDADWQHGRWGIKGIYLSHGSHGCVNLQPSVAKEVYNAISVGTPVIVYR